MKSLAANELNTKTGTGLEEAQQEPIQHDLSAQLIPVKLNSNEYEWLVHMENEYWLARAQEGPSGAFLGVMKPSQLFKKFV